MNTEKLIQQSPLTKVKLKEWFLSKLVASAEQFKEDDSFKEFMITSGITDDQITSVFEEGGRSALDMFDEHDVFINIRYNFKTKNFSYYINDHTESSSFKTRRDAEKQAFTQAVELLESKLTPEEEENENKEN